MIQKQQEYEKKTKNKYFEDEEEGGLAYIVDKVPKLSINFSNNISSYPEISSLILGFSVIIILEANCGSIDINL